MLEDVHMNCLELAVKICSLPGSANTTASDVINTARKFLSFIKMPNKYHD